MALASPGEELAWRAAFDEVAAALALSPEIRLVVGSDGRVALAGPTASVTVAPPHEDTLDSRMEQLYVAVARLQAPTARASLASLAPASGGSPPPGVAERPPVAAGPSAVEPSPPPAGPVVVVVPAPVPPEPTVAVVVRAPEPEPAVEERAPPPATSPGPLPDAALPAAADRRAELEVVAVVGALGALGAGPSAAVQVGRRAGSTWAAARIGGDHQPDARRPEVAYPVTAPVRASAVQADLAGGVALPDLPVGLGVAAGAAYRVLSTPDLELGSGVVPVVGAWASAELRAPMGRSRLVLRPELGVQHDLRPTTLVGGGQPIALVSTRGFLRLAVGVSR